MFSTYFKKNIYTEFLPPVKKSRKVMVLCGGMPGSPCKKHVMQLWSEQGYWVFFLRYRGTWESGGSFLARSPHEDVLDVVRGVRESFQDLWSQEEFFIDPSVVSIVGASFGGTAALLASLSDDVDHAVAFSPVVDWRTEKDTTEPLDMLGTFIRENLSRVYRGKEKDWDKLSGGAFFNPVNHVEMYDPKKLIMLWAQDDTIIDTDSLQKFCESVGMPHKEYKRGGHFGLSESVHPIFHRKIEKLLKKSN